MNCHDAGMAGRCGFDCPVWLDGGCEIPYDVPLECVYAEDAANHLMNYGGDMKVKVTYVCEKCGYEDVDYTAVADCQRRCNCKCSESDAEYTLCPTSMTTTEVRRLCTCCRKDGAVVMEMGKVPVEVLQATYKIYKDLEAADE